VVVVREDDAISASVVSEFPWVDLERVSRPGVLAAMRAGVERTQKEIVVLMDDDTVPPPNWLERLLREFSDPAVGGACGRDIVTRLDNQPRTLDVGRISQWGKVIGNHHRAGGAPRDVEILKGAGLAVRRTALSLPSNLKGAGAEVHWEVASCLWALDHGWRLRLAPECTLDHLPGPRFGSYERHNPRLRTSFDAAYNLVLCLTSFRRDLLLRRVLFGTLVGDTGTPGVIRGIYGLAQGDWSLAAHTPAAIAGQLIAAWRVIAGHGVEMVLSGPVAASEKVKPPIPCDE
jgi:glycosyltransferase involved in cell wall biosynthesis